MAVLEPENNDNNMPKRLGGQGMDFYPAEASKLPLHHQMALRTQVDKLKKATREQLFEIAVESLCMNYRYKNFWREDKRI